MADFLAQMKASSLTRAEAAARTMPERTLRAQAAAMPRPTPLTGGDFLLIAEVKRTSPAAGTLDDQRRSPADRAREYERGGAGVISVLTEPSRFQGSLDDLRQVSQGVQVPTMRKDFLADPYQVVEGRCAGASGVLLIVKMLEDATLERMLAAAAGLGMFVLVEAFDAEDLARCGGLAGRPGVLMGVNTRDLRDLSVRPERLESLAGLLPRGSRTIAESGVTTPAEAGHAASLGYAGVLVGTALMRAADPAALCAQMVEAGRAAAEAHR